LKPSQMVTPKPEIIREVKQSYNRVLKRFNEASKYLDSPDTKEGEKEKRILTFKIEIADALEAYLQVLQDWNVMVSEREILDGFGKEE